MDKINNNILRWRGTGSFQEQIKNFIEQDFTEQDFESTIDLLKKIGILSSIVPKKEQAKKESETQLAHTISVHTSRSHHTTKPHLQTTSQIGHNWIWERT